jgi:hypothetical protein
MIGRIPKLVGALVAAVAILALAAATAGAATIYNNLPKPLPKNVASEALEATSSAEFGGQVEFAGHDRSSPSITAVLSSWACQEGSGTTCHTNPGATFSWPITLNIYNVEPNGEPGTKIASVTETFAIPYRPSANNHLCTLNSENDVGYSKECDHGKLVKITFKPTVTLPSKAILSIAYNTSDYGYSPQRPQPCNATATGCPYDSLNIALTEPASEEAPVTPTPSVGTDPLPNYAYVNSKWSAEYGSEPHGAEGTFSLANEWTGYQPLFKVLASKG